jgi:hypothetical protein
MAGDDGKIVTDQDEPHCRFCPEPVDQPQDARLHGHIEGGGRLVSDDKARRAADRHRDHRPLALPTGEPEWIGLRGARRIGETHMVEQLHRALEGRDLRHPAMQNEGLGDLSAHPMQRIERRHRLLKDHRDPVAA